MALASSACSSTHHPPPPSFPSSCRCRCCCLQPINSRPLPNSAPCSVSTTNLAKKQRRRVLAPPPSALPDSQSAAASVLVTGIVGVAATLLLRSSSSSSSSSLQQQQEEEEGAEDAEKECWDCSGTGLCGRCKGEGFVFKQLSEDTATKARKAAKNMATRYTAGLPTKWTYCNKCSSTRSCTTCGGSGRIAATITST